MCKAHCEGGRLLFWLGHTYRHPLNHRRPNTQCSPSGKYLSSCRCAVFFPKPSSLGQCKYRHYLLSIFGVQLKKSKSKRYSLRQDRNDTMKRKRIQKKRQRLRSHFHNQQSEQIYLRGSHVHETAVFARSPALHVRLSWYRLPSSLFSWESQRNETSVTVIFRLVL